ncbi:hypothetical protein [Nitrosopumilus sp.]|uniref:hypothetical protein n=1 Tax=Nitrosopumilus sp. TaxID=2024843 RepID=UPI00292F6B3A|nr:hypothetical protein [Nitrosopumilus sp.]
MTDRYDGDDDDRISSTNSRVMDLKSPCLSDRDTQEQQTQKPLQREDAKPPSSYNKSVIADLLKIRIIQGDRIIDTYDLPEEVIVRPKAKTVEIHDNDGSLTRTYDLVKRDLSWLEDMDADCSEVVLDLHVRV